MSELLRIANNGPLIAQTNYWDLDLAKEGYCYLSWNDSAARLLLPDAFKPSLGEMTQVSEVVISRGQLDSVLDAYEIMFEDGSDSPYAIHILTSQSDRLVNDQKSEKPFDLHLYTNEGLVKSIPAHFRKVRTLPCLDAWQE